MDPDRDEVRAVFTAVLADPPPLGFGPADVERAARRRPRWVTVTAAAAAVALLAAGAVVLQRGTFSAAPPAAEPTAEPSPSTAAPTVYDNVLKDAAQAVGLATGPVEHDSGRPWPGAAAAEKTFRGSQGAAYTVRTPAGETGLLWAMEFTIPDGPVDDPRLVAAGACTGDAGTKDASLAGTEDDCTMIRLFGGPLIRVAHHSGTRPREIWTAYYVEPTRLIEVGLSSAGPSGDAPQLTGSPFSDKVFADLIRRFLVER